MLSVTFNKQGADVLLKNMANLNENFTKQAKIAMQDTMLDVQTTAKTSGYVPYKTGNLKRSITSSVDASGTKITGKVGSNLIYAGIQEFGGTITPKNGKYLKFQGSNGWVSVKRVTIIGKLYLTRAIKDNIEKLQKRLENLQVINNK